MILRTDSDRLVFKIIETVIGRTAKYEFRVDPIFRTAPAIRIRTKLEMKMYLVCRYSLCVAGIANGANVSTS